MLVTLAGIPVVAGAILACEAGSGGTEFPAPLPAVRDTAIAFEDFVGSGECEECHKGEYDAWKASTHGNAGGVPGEARIIAPFDGDPIRFRDALVTPLTAEDGRRVFVVEQRDQPRRVFEVAGVVGGGHMVGGGTQAFFSAYPDGTVRFLPFDFIRREGVWFCQTGGRADRGWSPITPEMLLADCNDWPPTRVLGSHQRFTNCQQCHGSQILLRYDTEERRYETRFTTLAINCESCHGPGSRHIEIADSDSIDRVTDIGTEALALRDADGSLQICFQCHAVKAELHPGFISGRALERYFGDLLLLLSYRPYFPDGRIRLFAYQQQHLYSDCYLNGSMTCVDCHDPHSQHYRDIWGEPLVGRFSDGQCLDCHASKAEEMEVRAADHDSAWTVEIVTPRREARASIRTDVYRVNSHTLHPVDSPGGRCIDCHMPYLQEPDVGRRLRYSRSDHTIPIPRARLDAYFGIENACVKCHSEKSPAEVEAKVEEWYGELKPLKSLISGLIDAQGTRDRVEAARLMLDPEDNYIALQFTNLSYFMLTHLGPDVPGLEDEVVDRLRRLAESQDPDLQALALASLHLAGGEERSIRSFLADRLRSLGSRDALIRSRWVWVLSFRGEAYTARNQFQEALATYRKAAEVLPDDPELLRKLGSAFLNLGDSGGAIRHLRRSVELEPDDPMNLVSLAGAHARAGDFAAAIETYRRAIQINPWETTTYVSLGRSLLGGRDFDGAIQAFQRAAILDPGSAEALFGLAQAHYAQGDAEEAVAFLEEGLKFDRGNLGARNLLARLRDQGR